MTKVINIIQFLKYVLQFCKENMEGKSFYAKGGKIFCKAHAAKYWEYWGISATIRIEHSVARLDCRRNLSAVQCIMQNA